MVARTAALVVLLALLVDASGTGVFTEIGGRIKSNAEEILAHKDSAAVKAKLHASEAELLKSTAQIDAEGRIRDQATHAAVMKEATAALNKIVAYEDQQGKTYDYSFAEVRSGDEAHGIFCKCQPHPSMGKALWEMCPGITEQCKRSFCRPLCLRMAWTPRIAVDCRKAPGWRWCPKFKAQVQQAQKTIEAQFQAHVCLDLHFCNESHHMNQWIENHSFGPQYPNPHLPIKTCKHDKISQQQEQLLCAACNAVVDVDIERGECLPQFKTLIPGSLQERCMYLADVIGNRKEFLLRIFKQRVCSCLGCCGTGKCFFQDPEENWLSTLVDSVKNKVTAQLEEEGWTILRRTPPLRKRRTVPRTRRQQREEHIKQVRKKAKAKAKK